MEILKMLDCLSISLGKWFGVPVTLHWSWVIMVGIIMMLNPPLALVVAGVFFMVLLHECGHCIAAQHYKVQVKDITLFPFGGAARMEIPWKPIPELVVALSGPLVNVLLIGPLYLASQFHWFFATMFLYNIVLIVFNMIPAFPMDGGRVLRSLLNLIWKDHYRATLWAVRTGQVFSVLFLILGVLAANLNLAIIGVFIFFVAQRELEVSKARSAAQGLMTFFQERRDVAVLDEEIAASEESIAILKEIQRSMGDIDRRYAEKD